VELSKANRAAAARKFNYRLDTLCLRHLPKGRTDNVNTKKGIPIYRKFVTYGHNIKTSLTIKIINPMQIELITKIERTIVDYKPFVNQS
jgi:hypothetical protein